MENNFKLYEDIAKRTDGDIYVGVVGPVRTGKSTFIKKFIENLIVPNIDDEIEKKRYLDEIPQSAEGKTIMTTEPKFVPNEAIDITIGDNVFIGSNSTILYDVNIGNNVIIGAGSLINRDIPSGTVAAGVPAKVINHFGSKGMLIKGSESQKLLVKKAEPTGGKLYG